MNPQVDNARAVTENPTTNQLSIAVIGPDESLRAPLLGAISECRAGGVHNFHSYPPRVQDVNNLLELKCNVVMIELDSDPDYAVEIVRAVCAGSHSTVMVYSRMTDSEVSNSDLLMRCMRLGAREFLNPPFPGTPLQEALSRAASRYLGNSETKKPLGRLTVFCAAKGGAGVTTIACNFAIALARQSGKKTLLIDMDLPLGDAALNLGINSVYSTVDALQNCSRLDSTFLSMLLVQHSSGLAVLPAPGRLPAYLIPSGAIDRLLNVARRDFDYIVVDAGSKSALTSNVLAYKSASTLYLVTQRGIPELRNASQILTHCQGIGAPKFEIVLNRYERSECEISDSDLARALGEPISWRIPSDSKEVRRIQDSSAPVEMSDSSIARPIEAMARVACGLPPEAPKEREPGLLRWFTRASKRPHRLDPSTDAKTGFVFDQRSGAVPDVACGPVGLKTGDGQPDPDLDRRSSPWNY